MSSDKITLKQWINQEGVSVIAEKLGVAQSAVRHWRRGHCLPRTDQMKAIKKLSRGAVSYDEMIDAFHSTSSK